MKQGPTEPGGVMPPPSETLQHEDRLGQAWERMAVHAARFLSGRAFLACCLAVASLCAIYRIFERPFDPWNDVRLARTFALFGNLEIYPSANEGPVLAGIYGPVGFAAYGPAALFSSPNPALAAGVLLSILMGLVPVVLILFHPALTPKADGTLKLLLLCYVFFHFYFASAEYGLWNVHVDAPILALCGVGLWGASVHGKRARFSWTLGLAILALALAPWAKQTAAPVLMAPLLYFWAIGNRRAAFEFGVGVLVAEGMIAAVLGAWFGFDRLYFSLVTVPSHHPRHISQLAFAGTQVEDFFDMSALAALAVFCACFLRQPAAGSSEPDRLAFDGGVWPVFLTAAVLALPTSILGRIKDGGTDNNYGLVDYFLTIAVGLWLLRLTALPAFRRHAVLPTALTAAVGLLMCIQMVRTIPDVARLPGQINAFLHGTPSQQAYEYASEHPGEVYFPWRPLATLLAERELYHVTYGIYQRELAGFPVTPDHLRQYLPDRMRYVAVEEAGDRYTKKLLPEFQCHVVVEGLGAWTVLAREQGDACAEWSGVDPTAR